MTARKCSDCAYVRALTVSREDWETEERCGVTRITRALCSAQRSPDGLCGPDAKLFAKREGA